MKFNLSLFYNGSVNHQVFVGDTNLYDNGLNGRHNINTPEWIISLNGIGIQILNFETNFFSKDISDNQISGNKMNLLIQGYHFSSRLTPADILIDPDRINIMAGDGSLITLINKSSSSGYSGTYVSESKGENYKAYVSFIETEGPEAYRTRRVEFMKGDGLVYIFEEIKIKFADFKVSESIVNVHRKPKCLLLKEIKDQFGNKILLGYNAVPVGMSEYIYGRPLVSDISSSLASLNFIYGITGMKINHNSEINGSYFVNFTEPVNYNQGTDYNHMALIWKIRNPNTEEAFVNYENYIRKYNDVPNPFQTGNLILNFSNLRRLKWFRNFNGAGRAYTYLGSNTMEISLNIPYNHFLKSMEYYGYGRDAFYVNMLSGKLDTNEVAKAQETFFYNYNRNREECNIYSVDSSDYYESIRVRESVDGSTVNSG
ncbi:MAG: hypothetical protein N2510_06940 [Ignavibacteria bacterium]|nr:hypothetical protein [Ignavibacteria bacterium]